MWCCAQILKQCYQMKNFSASNSVNYFHIWKASNHSYLILHWISVCCTGSVYIFHEPLTCSCHPCAARGRGPRSRWCSRPARTSCRPRPWYWSGSGPSRSWGPPRWSPGSTPGSSWTSSSRTAPSGPRTAPPSHQREPGQRGFNNEMIRKFIKYFMIPWIFFLISPAHRSPPQIWTPSTSWHLHNAIKVSIFSVSQLWSVFIQLLKSLLSLHFLRRAIVSSDSVCTSSPSGYGFCIKFWWMIIAKVKV